MRRAIAGGWLLGGETVEVECDVDIEQTPLSFHAHAVPDGIEIRPGDSVQVHGVPSEIDFGDAVTCRCPATVTRAGALRRVLCDPAERDRHGPVRCRHRQRRPDVPG